MQPDPLRHIFPGKCDTQRGWFALSENHGNRLREKGMAVVTPLVHFVHIPKTGGNTILMILRRQYGRDHIEATLWGPQLKKTADQGIGIFVGPRHTTTTKNIWHTETAREAGRRLTRMDVGQGSDTRAIYGSHSEFGLHEYMPCPLVSFTVLRKPEERVVSHYYFTVDFWNRPESVDLYDHIAGQIESNLQTRIMGGPYGGGLLPPPKEMLSRARCNLKKCVVVGLMERFDETVLLLAKALGWRMPLYTRRMVNKSRPDISMLPEAVSARLKADNHLDEILYTDGVKLFEAQLAAYGPTLNRDLIVFRGVNGPWQLWQTLWRTILCKARNPWAAH